MGNLKVGLQLYSIRDKMEADMDAALRAVKEIGYDYVEFAGYFDKSAEEQRRNRCNLPPMSSKNQEKDLRAEYVFYCGKNV